MTTDSSKTSSASGANDVSNTGSASNTGTTSNTSNTNNASSASGEIYGTLQVADRVISDLIGYAAMESYGIVGMAAPSLQDSVAKLLPARALRRGVTVKPSASGFIIDLYVIIEYGVNLLTVSKNLEDRVRFVMDKYAELPVDTINIHVQGIHVQ